jgi:hypothetical protein
MLRRYTFWLTAAVLFQLITGIVHLLSLFLTPTVTDDTHRQILTLVTSYKINAGLGFTPTYYNIFTALSSCFSFLCFFAGLTNGYLLLKHTEPAVMRGIVGINVAIFGLVLLTFAYFTFPTLIFFAGLIFFNLLAAFVMVPKIEAAVEEI